MLFLSKECHRRNHRFHRFFGDFLLVILLTFPFVSRFRIGVVRVGDVKVGGVVRVGDVFDVLSVVITHLEVYVCCVSLFGFVSKVRLVDSVRDTTKKGLDQLLSRPVNHVGRCHCRCYCYIVKVLVKDRARPPAVPPAIPPSSTPPPLNFSGLTV